jgi:hypothetical protein
MNQISFLRGVPAEEALEAVSELIAANTAVPNPWGC